MIEIESTSLEQTLAVGRAVAQVADAGDVISLKGELGAGKTQFVRGMATGLGIDPQDVSSPTFVIMHEYDCDEAAGRGVQTLVHMDAYRLVGPDDLATVGWMDQGQEIRDSAVVAVEWGGLIREAMGPDVLEVTLSYHGDGRWIVLSPCGRWCDKMDQLESQLAPLHAL